MLKKITEKKDAHPDIRWKSGIKGEGKVAFPDDPKKPSRTITTAESGANRMTHGILVDRGKIKKTKISTAIDAHYYKGVDKHAQRTIIRIGGLFDKGKETHQAGSIYDSKGISPILDTAQGGHREPLIPDFARIRRLIPKECERLQGFPDDWTKEVSDTQRYKAMGNAVSVPVIEAIGNKILEVI